MLNGVITTRDVFLRGPTIARLFGALAWLRCLKAVCLGTRTTFLDCVVVGRMVE